MQERINAEQGNTEHTICCRVPYFRTKNFSKGIFITEDSKERVYRWTLRSPQRFLCGSA